MTEPNKTTFPFPFVLDELMPLRLTIKRAFGFTYLYLDEVILCGLRESSKKPSSNGIWLFTNTEHVESLGKEFPDLPRRYLWRSGNNAWIVLSSRLEHFEEYAFKACDMILKGDRRIGRLSRAKKLQGNRSKRIEYFNNPSW